MSIVTEALASSGALAKDDLSTKILKLSNHAFDVKQELFDFTEQSFVDFYPLLSSTEHIHAKLSSLKSEVDNLQLSLDSVVKNQIKDSTKEYEQLSKEHSKTLRLVAALEKIYEVHKNLMEHNTNVNTKNLHQAAVALDKIEKCMNDFEDSALAQSKICKAINTDFVCKRENLLYTLGEIWKKCISIVQDEGDSVKLTINFDEDSDSFDRQDLICAMHTCGILERRIKKLGEVIMKELIKPCIINNAFSPTISDTNGVVLGSKIDENTSDQQQSPEEVFGKLKIILWFLHDNLLKYRLFPSDKSNDTTLMATFRSVVAEELINVLVEQCLMKSVPESKEGLRDYDKIEKQVKEFENMLKQIGFLDNSSSSSLIDFVSNINTHFANQRCIAVLAKARNLMKSDLYETVQVEPCSFSEIPENVLEKLKNSQAPQKHALVKKAITTVLKPSKPLDDNTMRLPRFRISRGTKEVVDLAYQTLHEATKSSAECAIRLISTTQSIFEIYAAIVPVYHRDALAKLPQVSALHYNDCWYIAHHLLTMGHQFSEHLPSKELDMPLTFVHQVSTIRQLGCDCFLSQMRQQRGILQEFLSPLKKFSSFPNKNKFQMAEKPVKQVSHVLNHLRSVWSDVLPTNVTNTSLATLADCATAEVINSICTLEDISSDDSVQYSNICRLLRDEITSLFSDEGTDLSWQREQKKWQRLCELILVLDSSLRVVVDRWSEGKGPLANAFTNVEVKGLIRALFQNTDQRANAISKIRY